MFRAAFVAAGFRARNGSGTVDREGLEHAIRINKGLCKLMSDNSLFNKKESRLYKYINYLEGPSSTRSVQERC